MKNIIVLISLFIFTGCGSPFFTAGPPGVQGPTGVAGANGAPGADCTVTSIAAGQAAPNGGSLIQCPGGSQSLVLNGTNGQNGAQGSTGAQGSAGTPGTIITSVQFCAGTTNYPSNFFEVGFCISNTLYAVYSQNDGFLTEVPPGSYTSDGINASCNFTVGENCAISY
jgi:hypothetical protein